VDDIKEIGGAQCIDGDRQKLLCLQSLQPARLAAVYYAEYVINVSRRPHACARNETE